MSAVLKEMSDLPEGWKLKPIGEIVQPTRPRISPSEKPELPFLGMDHIEAHTMRMLGSVPARTMKSSAVHFQPGDVLYGRLRPYLNKVFQPHFEGLCSAEFIVFPETDELDNKYLQYFLNSSTFVRHATSLNSGDRPRVKFEQLAPYEIPLPPTVGQQKRIVAKIEELFSYIDAGIEALKKAKQLLKQYRQSVLKAAVTGDLTKEWREANKDKLEPASQLLERILKERRQKWEEQQLEQFKAKGKIPKDDKWKEKYKEYVLPDSGSLPTIPEGWIWVNLQHVFDVITDGDHQAPPKSDEGVPFLVIGNVNKGILDFNGTRFVPKSYFNGLSEIRTPRKGDLLYTVVGSYGIPVKVETDKEFCVQRHIAILKPSNEMNVDYLYCVLSSGFVFKQATEVATGTAQKTIPLGGLREINIPLPPLAEQLEIAQLIETKFIAMDRLENESETKIVMAEKNRQSILGDAFSGKFVKPLDSDEPATRLLQRIQEKAHTVKKKTAGSVKPASSRQENSMRRKILEVLKEEDDAIEVSVLMQKAGFDTAEVEEFYYELGDISELIEEVRPGKKTEKSWPYAESISVKLRK